MKYKELTQNISGSLKTLAQDSPDLMKSFNQLSQVAMRDGVIDPKTKVFAIEASAGNEWYRFADEVIGMKRFGASAPADLLFKKFGLTADAVTEKVCATLGVTYQASSGTSCKC